MNSDNMINRDHLLFNVQLDIFLPATAIQIVSGVDICANVFIVAQTSKVPDGMCSIWWEKSIALASDVQIVPGEVLRL